MLASDVQAKTASAARVPSWARLAAWGVPLCVLPSAAWRLQHALDVLMNGPGLCGIQGQGEAVYVGSLSVVSMSTALLTLGLVSSWGEVIPTWIPWASGRVVPMRAVVGGAVFVAVIVAALQVYYIVKEAFGLVESRPLAGCSTPGLDVLIYYIPLLAWAPLLGLVTRHYYQRRRRHPTGLNYA